jgi:hypothetical protein
MHAILRQHVQHRRVSLTLRELTPIFLPGGEQEAVGAAVVERALTFAGVAVGTVSPPQ